MINDCSSFELRAETAESSVDTNFSTINSSTGGPFREKVLQTPHHSAIHVSDRRLARGHERKTLVRAYISQPYR